MAKNLVNKTLRLRVVEPDMGSGSPDALLRMKDDVVVSIEYLEDDDNGVEYPWDQWKGYADNCLGMSERMVRDWSAGFFAEYAGKYRPSLVVTEEEVLASLVGMVAHEPLKTQMINLLETHYEVSTFLSQRRDLFNDRTECFTLARMWTFEFEEKNLGREWDGEFYDEIDAFCEQKMAQYLNK